MWLNKVCGCCSLSEGFASAAPHPVNGGQVQPHYGTQAAVGAAQEVTRLATEQLRSLTGQQTLQLPPLPPVKQAGELHFCHQQQTLNICRMQRLLLCSRQTLMHQL